MSLLNKYRSPAVERALDILEYLAGAGTATLADIVRDRGLPKSTAFVLLVTLRDRGYVIHNAEGRYQLGLRLVNLGHSAVERIDITEVSQPVMSRLAADIKETVHLGVLSGTSVVQVGKAESPLAVKLTSYIGQLRPLHSTAMGKTLLAFLPADEREDLLRRITLARKTPRTITRPEVLRQELDEVCARGYAVDDEETNMGVRCVGAPIRNYTGRVVAALSVSGPAERIPLSRVPEVAQKVMAGAQEISRALGYL